MVMSPVGLWTKNHFASGDQQQLSSQSGVKWLIWNVRLIIVSYWHCCRISMKQLCSRFHWGAIEIEIYRYISVKVAYSPDIWHSANIRSLIDTLIVLFLPDKLTVFVSIILYCNRGLQIWKFATAINNKYICTLLPSPLQVRKKYVLHIFAIPVRLWSDSGNPKIDLQSFCICTKPCNVPAVTKSSVVHHVAGPCQAGLWQQISTSFATPPLTIKYRMVLYSHEKSSHRQQLQLPKASVSVLTLKAWRIAGANNCVLSDSCELDNLI
jgi:hypothetical protein